MLPHYFIPRLEVLSQALVLCLPSQASCRMLLPGLLSRLTYAYPSSRQHQRFGIDLDLGHNTSLGICAEIMYMAWGSTHQKENVLRRCKWKHGDRLGSICLTLSSFMRYPVNVILTALQLLIRCSLLCSSSSSTLAVGLQSCYQCLPAASHKLASLARCRLLQSPCLRRWPYCTDARTSPSLITMYCLSSCANSVPLYLL